MSDAQLSRGRAAPVSPPGRDYLNRNMLDDEPPAYTPIRQPRHERTVSREPVQRAQERPSSQRLQAHGIPFPSALDPPRSVSPVADGPAPNVHGVSNAHRRRRLVLAVDFGTTFSGVAFTTTDAHHAVLDEIDVIQDWTTRMSNMDKVPSVKSYSRASNGEAQWGSDISENAITMVNQKLELEIQDSKLDELDLTLYVLKGAGYLSFDHLREAGSNPDFSCKAPEEVVADYLEHIFGCARQAINVDQLRTTDTAIDLVITVPVVWSYQGWKSIFNAMKRAGFNKTILPTLKDTILIHEPEAAALFTAQDLKSRGTQFLHDDQCFILCDAGGGTVDAVAYQVIEVDPLLRLERATAPTGCKRGSAYIDTAFKLWLRKVLGPDLYAEIDPVNARRTRISPHTAETGIMRSLIKQFSARKEVFSNHDRASIKIDLPAPLDSLTHNNVVQGELTIPWKDMKNLMDTCVNDVIKLIVNQIEAASQRKGRRIRKPSDRTYFWLAASANLPIYKKSSKQVSKTTPISDFDAQMMLSRVFTQHGTVTNRLTKSRLTAVVQGGVIYGCEKARHKDVTFMKEAPKSYGVLLGSDQKFHWLIKKGDLLLSNQSVPAESLSFFQPSPGRNKKVKVSVYSYVGHNSDDEFDLPEDWSSGRKGQSDQV
ncbi:hypothetical protein HII31_07716 [Pseudocercospora fuligena]|uniref:Uncharacterized protein n=1 Tax=Pseudocercospora fuligena TaxID=685502 RepID=A0A8H6VHE1_9PEZI|nr:hypothetical protein HII31_07716 [Pseudocercospora fuligena]